MRYANRLRARRNPIFTLARGSYSMALILAALVVVVASLPQLQTPSAGKASRHAVHLRAALTSGGAGLTVPYTPGELYSGGSEVEACPVCEAANASGESQGHSGTEADDVDPTTGNLAYSYDGFSVSTADEPLEFELTYNSDLAQSQLESGSTYGGAFGFGWQDATGSNVTLADGVASVYQPGGATSTFPEESGGSCPTGYSVQTITGSSATYCGVLRQNAQYGSSSTYGFEEYNESGGLDKYIYNVYGAITNAGNLETDAVLTYHNDVAVGTASATGAPVCPSTVAGGVAVSDCTQIVDLGQREITFVFNDYGGVAEVIDPAGNDYLLNVSGNLLQSVTRPLTSTTTAQSDFSYATASGANYVGDLTEAQSPDEVAAGTGTAFSYNSTGMVNGVITPNPVGGSYTTYYGYSNTSCPTACLGSGDVQDATVIYPDGDEEKTDYTEGLMTSKDLGWTSSSSPGSDWTYTHNSYDEPTDETLTDPLGRTSNIVTDAYGNDLAVTDAEGHTTSSAYNAFDQVCWSAPVATTSTSCGDPPTDATVYTYDQYGNLIATVDPLGNHTTSSYDSLGDELTTTDADGNTTTKSYNGDTGDVASSTDPLGNVTTSSYSPDGWVTSSVSPLGNVSGGTPSTYTTTDSYNLAGWLTSETTPGGRTTTTTYDKDGNVIETVDPQGYATSSGYDYTDRQCWSLKGANTTATCASPPANATVIADDVDTSNPATVTTQTGTSAAPQVVITEYSYQDLAYPDQATAVQNWSSSTTEVSVVSNVYDADGETCLTGTAAAGSGLWDGYGTHTCAWQPNYTYTRYDQDGNPTIVQDPAGNDTIYNYDDSLLPTLVTKSTNAIGVGSTYTYDLDGQLLDVADSAGNTTSYAYDPDGNVCWKSPSFASSDCGSTPSGTGVTTYAYDADDQRTAMTDNAGTGTAATTNYAYDANSEVVSTGAGTAAGDANTTSYTYNPSGDITCIAYPTAGGSTCANAAATTNPIVAKGYNSDGQVTSVEDWDSNTTSFSYYGSGLNEGDLEETSYPTNVGESVTYALNDADQVTSTAYAGAISGLGGGTWNYSDALQTSDTGGSVPGTFSYTPKDQVSADGTSTYNYGTDNNENELQSVTTGSTTTTNTFNAGEELTSSATGSTTTTYGYDNNGNRCWSSATSTTGSCSSPPSGASTYTWNAYHQLTASQYNATAATYAYNGDGLRTTDTIGSTTQNFAWDEVSDPSQPLTLEDSSNAYIYGPTTTPIEQISLPLSTGTPQYLATDPGGVRYLLGSSGTSGTLDETLSYSAFGTPTTSGTSSTPFGFQGAYTDSDGLVYLINRYYDPATDQFLSVDPDVAETGEPYAFDGNDPLNQVDPVGLCWGWCWVRHAYHRVRHAIHRAVHAVRHELHSAVAHRILNDVSRGAGIVAGGASLVATVTAGVPVVGEVAEGVSIAAGSVAVGADVANCIGGHCNRAQLGLDASALIPGVAATRFANVADDAADTASLAESASHASANSLMDAQTTESSFRSYQRTSDAVGFGFSTAAWSASVANNNG